MSLILDGMDQAHNRVPHMANISSFGHPLWQHVQGVQAVTEFLKLSKRKALHLTTENPRDRTRFIRVRFYMAKL